MHKIYGPICESSFDWSTFPLNAVISLTGFGQRAPCLNHIFLAHPQSSCTLEGKRPAEHVQKWGGGGGLGHK